MKKTNVWKLMFLVLFLTIIMPCYVKADDEITSGDYKYRLEQEYTPNGIVNYAVISDYLGNESNIIVPSTIDGYKVKEVGNLFGYNENRDSIVSISISDGIERLEDTFWYLNNLRSITIPKSVTTLHSLFLMNNAIEEITLPEGGTYDLSYAFNNCTKLKKVNILGNAVAYGDAFRNCNNLEELTIKLSGEHEYEMLGINSLKTAKIIGDPVTLPNFEKMTNLTTVYIPESIKRINNAFMYCYALKDIYYAGSPMQWKAISIKSDVNAGDKLNSATIHYGKSDTEAINSSIIKYGSYAVDPLRGFCFSITGSNTVSFVGIYGSDDQREVNIPDYITIDKKKYNVTSVSGAPYYSVRNNKVIFSNYNKNTSIKKLVIGKNVKTIGEKAFYCFLSLNTVTGGKNVTTIEELAFYNCRSLKTVTLGTKVTKVGSGAFHNCAKLGTIKIGNNLKEIGDYAFSGCKKLSSITLGKKLKTIGTEAFYYCKSLKSITIPASVNKIGKHVFYYCKKLETIVIKTKKLTNKNVGENLFEKAYTKVRITVPKKYLQSYEKLLQEKGLSKKATVVPAS